MRLLAELKRRNVIRMAGLYLVGAWLVTQVAATLLPVFEAPAWVMKVLVGLLAVGFLAALAFSWAFELTPDGLQRDANVAPGTSIAPQAAQRMNRLIIALLILALAYFGFDKFHLAPQRQAALVASTSAAAKEASPAASKPASAQASIAVLPFVNMSTDVENGFFADGISEELLNVLAGVQGLKVASRTSAFSFKGKDTPIPEIARQLGVQHVLEGSVRKQGARVRITAQLIHAGSDGHLWSETYDRDLTDIFKVQEEIAQAIAGELGGILGKQQVAVTASTANLAAYQSFLKGRARFHRRDELLLAVDDLASAVEQDPAFAEAWVYLAAVWLVIPGYIAEADVTAAAASSEFRTALAQAARLAPGHPMVAALQSQLLELNGDLVGALAQLDESVTLSVNDSNPRMWRGALLLRSGYVDEAIAALESAQAMDPLAGINNGHLALAYLSDGQYEKAEATARRAASQGWAHAVQVIIFDLAARAENERAIALFDEFSTPPTSEREAENYNAVRSMLRDPETAGSFDGLRPADQAPDIEFSIAIDRVDAALAGVQQALADDQERRGRQWWLRSAWLPSTVGLRTNPRFFAIAEALGMARLWERRGYPDGCRRVAAPAGDHLACAGMPP